MRITTLRIQNWLFSVFLALALFFLLFLAQVYADGGAPNLAYVGGTPQKISIIDVLQQRVISIISLNGSPQTILLSRDGRLLYATQPTLGRVAIFDTRTGKATCSASLLGQPSLLALDPTLSVLYVAGNRASIVTALDPTSCTVQHTFKTEGPVYGLAVVVTDPNKSNQLWISDRTSLKVFDERTGQRLATIPIPDGPQYICFPGDLTVYATTRKGNVVAVDLFTRKVSHPLLTGGEFGPMDYDANTGEIYVPDEQHKQLDVLAPIYLGAPSPHEPSRVIQLVSPPQAVAITSDGRLGFVALSSGNVLMFDIPGRQVIKSIHVGGDPRFIITGLYPPKVDPAPIVASTSQWTSIWEMIISTMPYVVVIALLLIPALLIWRNRLQSRR